jgi:hypothetical protein
MKVTQNSFVAEAKKFNGSHEDAINIQEWAEGIEVSWTPLDDNYDAQPGEEPDLSKGVSLDIVGTLGYQSAEKDDWLIRDDRGIIVMSDENFKHYYEIINHE